uniref:SCP domain-containing protein n=1 Tax=Strongyloides venezuelensis TaxID=75913 RepID=A0A0K0G227_STRVS
MLFIYIHLLFLVILKCMSYNLAVTYKIIKVGKTHRYLYRGKIYRTKNQMLIRIISDHPKVSTSKLLLLNIGTHNKNTFEGATEYEYEKPFPMFGHLKVGTIIVQEYYQKNRVFYYCVHRLFDNYELAVAYARLINFRLKFCCVRKEYSEIPHELNVAKKVGYYGFSNKVWRSVWKGCYYHSCFAEDNYRQLMLRFLNEINEYRLNHGAGVVITKSILTKIAGIKLTKILTTPEKYLDRSLLHNYVETPYYFAPLIIKKWYDENKHYKYGTKVSITGTEHFTAIVWKSVKYVGFAVREIRDMVHFLVVFGPEPNGPKLFSSNVQKRNLFLFSRFL